MRQLSKHISTLVFAFFFGLNPGLGFTQTIENSVTSGYTLDWYGAGQSFTATVNGRVEAISVRPDQGSQQSLRIYDNGSASGTPLLIQDVTLVAVGPSEFQKIVLSVPFSITAGSQYSFVLMGSPSVGFSLGYPGGDFLAASNESFIQDLEGADLTFQVFEIEDFPFTFLAPAIIPPAKIGESYNLQLTATGGSGGYTYSIDSGSLPDGLTINPVSGEISGTPTTAGSATATILAKDNTTHQQTASVTIVVDPLDLTATNQLLPGGQVGQAYSASILVSGGMPPYSFTLTGDLPEGLTLNPATGAITGTPTKAQTSTFSVTIEDSTLLPQSAMAKVAVHSTTQSFSITVAAAPQGASPIPVPTLNDWGLLLLSALTIGAARYFTRKRTIE